MSVDTIETRRSGLAATPHANLFRAAVVVAFVVVAWAMLMSLGDMRAAALESGLFRMLSL